jgi:2-dehydropantoate 2-reductase
MLACTETSTMARRVIEEGQAVALARGVQLSEDASDRMFRLISSFAKENPAARSSMYYDLIRGRRLELEAINGAVVRLGREEGVATPMNLAVYAALEPYAGGGHLPESA